MSNALGKVLIVDEEVKLAKIVSEWLEDVGYEVLHSNSVASAIDIYADNIIDVMLVDWHIEREGGAEWLLERVRKMNGSKCKIVIMLSGSASLHIETKVSGFLMKPFTSKDLKNVFDSMA